MFRFLARRLWLQVADYAVTMPVVRWTWTSPTGDKSQFAGALAEFRPTDRETILEMMAGRYLLASKLVDTHGVSPFAIEAEDETWYADLQGFSWLRHFRDARDEGERRFARTLTLDWIGRNGNFDRENWAPALCAPRVLNWLRHYGLLVEGANPDQISTIQRCLNSQIQSLRLRTRFSTEPLDQMLAAIALVGAALCDESRAAELGERVMQLRQLLDVQIDEDGLHRTRSAKVQLQLLTELVTIRIALKRFNEELEAAIGDVIESMHLALDAISLGTGEPAYFNGTGHLPHDLLIAVQIQSASRHRDSGTCGGYARLMAGPSVVVADGGMVPSHEFAAEAHSSALAFEFSYRTELIVGSCGPAPSELADSALLFRQGVAHSGPTINAMSAAVVPLKGPMAGRLVPRGAANPELRVQPSDPSLMLQTDGYARRFGVMLERRMTLMAEGKTLVGQDRMTATPGGALSGMCTVRFHLASGTKLYAAEDENLLRMQLASGSMWTFIWEGAEMRVEDSVRQSAYFGFHRTRQIVLEAEVENGREIAWIFTLVEQ